MVLQENCTVLYFNFCSQTQNKKFGQVFQLAGIRTGGLSTELLNSLSTEISDETQNIRFAFLMSMSSLLKGMKTAGNLPSPEYQRL